MEGKGVNPEDPEPRVNFRPFSGGPTGADEEDEDFKGTILPVSTFGPARARPPAMDKRAGFNEGNVEEEEDLYGIVSSGSSFPAIDFRPIEERDRLDNFILSIIVAVISDVERIFGAADVDAFPGDVLVDLDSSSTASKAFERTLGEARDLDGVLPRVVVEALRGVALLLVDSVALGVVDSDSDSAAARREGVWRRVGVWSVGVPSAFDGVVPRDGVALLRRLLVGVSR